MIMEYTLYAPQNITARTSDLDDIKMLLALPKLARFVEIARASGDILGSVKSVFHDHSF